MQHERVVETIQERVHVALVQHVVHRLRRCHLSAGHRLSVPPRCCLPRLAMLAAYSFAVVRVVSSLMGLRPSLALRGDGGRRIIHADDDGHSLDRHILNHRCGDEAW